MNYAAFHNILIFSYRSYLFADLGIPFVLIWTLSIEYSGHVRGGSGGSADPPKILEPIEKKQGIDILS